jgi:serine/threonine-protein kinase HipA
MASEIFNCDVWIRLFDGTALKAGEFIGQQLSEYEAQSTFSYSAEYLQDPRAYSLDPFELPLHDASINVKYTSPVSAVGLHSAFSSALPDQWGRKLLFWQHDLVPERVTGPVLRRMLGDSALGAIVFGDKPVSDGLGLEITASKHLMTSAVEYLNGAELRAYEEQFEQLVQCGGSLGGSQPKVLVYSDNQAWIAKFQDPTVLVDLPGLEAASLANARRCGLTVPNFRVDCLHDVRVLLVQRFDITAMRGRRHMRTFKDIAFSEKLEDCSQLGYVDLADIIRRHSASPQHDLERLFRQAVFNIGLGNRDDHLKNFTMLQTETGPRLSPVYDVQPNVSRRPRHVLEVVNGKTRDITRDDLLQLSIAYSLDREVTESIIDEVCEGLLEWPRYAFEYDLPMSEVVRYTTEIQENVARLSRPTPLLKKPSISCSC